MIEDKISSLAKHFEPCASQEERYLAIIAMGRALPPFPQEKKNTANRVSGCQSITYLAVAPIDDSLTLTADSDALISKGLAAILIYVYNGETAEVILKHKPHFLEDLKIAQSLTPNRASGLYSMHLHLQQTALRHLQPA
ncbi:MAG: SufE family protein [Chlamydiia bacterium]|nr:SufE family protein [Chlamydiia bacterium]